MYDYKWFHLKKLLFNLKKKTKSADVPKCFKTTWTIFMNS